MAYCENIAVRLDEAIIARIDALIPRFSEPWREATRSDILRMIIRGTLERIEKDPRILEEMSIQAEHHRRGAQGSPR